MNKKLAGVVLIKNAISLDYCIEASIRSMEAICDHVIVVYVESEDDTLALLKSIQNDKITILNCFIEQWDSVKGQQKLSVFQNIGVQYAQEQGYEYVLLVQGDEALHQDSIHYIDRAIALGEDAYYCTRYNLWRDENSMLNVPQSRKPVSTVVNRLFKSCYRTFDDGESAATPTASLDFINLIEIFHVGFIRNHKKHIAKIKEIQGNVFEMTVDSRASIREEFDWRDWGFTESDLVPIPKQLPIYLNDWIKNLNK